MPGSVKKNSGKHKRGERGSLEQEDNVSKRRNMADSVEGLSTAAATQPELNLTDIKELLVDIQITVATILRENQALKQEILELKSALNATKRETEKLKTQLTKAEKASDTLRDKLNHTRMKLKDRTEEINKLEEKYDDLKQSSRKNSLEILDVPESAYTTTDEVVTRIGEAINVNIKPEDIEISHKVKRKTTKLVIVKFLSHKVTENLFSTKREPSLKTWKPPTYFQVMFPRLEKTSLFLSTRILQTIEKTFLESKQDEER